MSKALRPSFADDAMTRPATSALAVCGLWTQFSCIVGAAAGLVRRGAGLAM
ncbi:hypothetical protein [Loktanella sp. R86503]|uniref:hypothetical protein n=1 Tax=Loktanella sp. R86503 TaxID=3093847 RepID=UPI0036DD4876